MAGFPSDNAFDVPVGSAVFENGDFADAQGQFLLACKQLPGGKETEDLVLSGKTITPTRFLTRIDTQGMASSDSLRVINYTHIPEGGLLALFLKDASRTIQIQHVVGNIYLSGAQHYTLDSLDKGILLRRIDNYFRECTFRSSGLSTPTLNSQLFTSSGTFNVPAGVTTVFVTAMGGGGGGGGGAGGHSSGPNNGQQGGNGQAGTNSIFNGVTARGGYHGNGATASGQGGLGYPNGQNAGESNATQQAPFPTMYYPYGLGGVGGAGAGYSANHGAGGAAGETGIVKYRVKVSVTPLAALSVTVGSGGTGGSAGVGDAANGSPGGNGSNGFVLIEW